MAEREEAPYEPSSAFSGDPPQDGRVSSPRTDNLPEGFLDSIPRTITFRTGLDGLPHCYHGTPLEMVEQMAKEMNRSLGVHEAIDLLLQLLEEAYELQLEIPGADIPESERAAIFIAALIHCHVAQAVATA